MNITADLKEHMHDRDTFKIKQASRSDDPLDLANFKRMRNNINTEIKAAKLFTVISLSKPMATP